MANEPNPNSEKNEMRLMWMGSAAIVLLLLGAMGVNMLMTHSASTGSPDASTQSGSTSPN